MDIEQLAAAGLPLVITGTVLVLILAAAVVGLAVAVVVWLVRRARGEE